MLKRIHIKDVRAGMYLQEMCGAWIDHPFWRSRFRIDDEQDVKRLRESRINEVWIDTAKGLDVEQGQVKQMVGNVADLPASAPDEVARVSLADEVGRAADICAKAKQAVAAMFSEVRMGKALDVEQALPMVDEISNSMLRNPAAFISLARLKTKDDYTYMHSVAVCALMVALARQLGLDEAQTRRAGLAGLLHDIGKMAIPLEILNKPGKLTDEEFVIVRNHPVEGYQMLLEGQGLDEVVLDVCRHHHEKIDGSGYPDGLAGDQISLYAKMGAVCDVYDAITSNRPYKEGWCPAESLRRMADWCNYGQFDAKVFQAFVRSVGIYPVGSLVRMESGRLGVVIEQGEKSLLKPKIKVFYSIKSSLRIVPEVLDMSHKSTQDRIAGHEEPAKWNFPDFDEIWSGIPQHA